jgi:hypothetical protein
MRIVLLLDEGTSYRDIEEKLGAAPSIVSRWKQRYDKDGGLGLATIHPGQPPQKLTPQLRANVLEQARQAPGEVIGQTAARHTSQEFVDFLDEVVSNQPAGQEIHVILDNFANPQKGFGEALPSTAPEREIALRTHLLLVAQSG